MQNRKEREANREAHRDQLAWLRFDSLEDFCALADDNEEVYLRCYLVAGPVVRAYMVAPMWEADYTGYAAEGAEIDPEEARLRRSEFVKVNAYKGRFYDWESVHKGE